MTLKLNFGGATHHLAVNGKVLVGEKMLNVLARLIGESHCPNMDGVFVQVGIKLGFAARRVDPQLTVV